MGSQETYLKIAGLHAFNFIKKRLQHRWFLVKFKKFLRKPFLWSNSGGASVDYKKVIFLEKFLPQEDKCELYSKIFALIYQQNNYVGNI